MDCSPPGSSVHGISQARILEWITIPSLGDLPDLGIESELSYCVLSTGGFPDSSVGKESSYSARDPGSIPGSGRSPGEENGSPLQYSCLGNPMDRGAWQAAVHGVAKELDIT